MGVIKIKELLHIAAQARDTKELFISLMDGLMFLSQKTDAAILAMGGKTLIHPQKSSG